MATGHHGQRLRKKRHLLLAVASSCRHVITSDQSPYFLVGHVELVAVCKYTEFFLYRHFHLFLRALPVGRLARVMTPVSPSKRPVISVHLSQMTR